MTGDQALTALAEALAEAAGDPTLLCSPDLDALADRVAETCPDIEHHLPARLAIGQLHLLRFLVLARRPGTAVEAVHAEARRAEEWLRPVAERDAIPEPVRPALDLLRRLLDQRQPEADALRARITVDRRNVANSNDRVAHLASLGIDLRMLYDRTGNLADLREAAAVGRELVAATSPEHPDFALHLSVLGVPLGMLADRIGDLPSLRDAVEFAQYCCVAIPDKAPGYGGELSNFGLALRNLYERTGDEAALLLARTAGRAAVAALPPGHPVHAKVLGNLSGTLLRLYERAGDDDVLREAEDTIRAAVDGLSGHPDRGVFLANLCMILTKRADRTGDLTLFQEAVRHGRESLTAMPPGDPDRAIGLADLSLALCLSAELTGDLAALREAERVIREAVDSASATDPQRGLYLDILGIALRMSYERTRELALLRDAVAAHRAAVDAVTPGQPVRAPFLANLSVALSLLFQATGDLAALRDATRTGQEAVAASPAGDPEHAGRAMNVGTGLLLAAERVEEEAVLREALRITRDAVGRIPVNRALHARFLVNLANGLSALFVRTGAIAALHEAVAASRAAVAAIPPDHPSYRAVALFGLARVQLRHYRLTGDVTALREAARAGTDAVAAIPRGHHREPRVLGLHSHVLMTMAEHTGDAATLRKAVRLGHQALAGLPLDHFDRVPLLANLAVAHGRLSEDVEARRLLTAAAAITTAPAAQRIHAARNAADLHLHAGDHSQAVRAVELALELLPQLASRDLTRADREYGVAATAGLASTAAAVFLAVGQPERAVEALEQTRGLVLAGTLDIRDEHADLRAHAPELADEFDDLCRALDAADHDEDATGPRRAELNRRWHELLGRIRVRLPGFLRPPSIDELRLAGPIVYVTAHAAAGHALIVDGERPVRVVTLPGLTDAVARTLVAELRGSDVDLLGVLGRLWDVVARPVLRELGHTDVPSGTWPRIWWCPVGVVTFLPLHAAGHHTQTADTVLDRAISSYTPTLRALAHARARRAGHESMVVVAVPDAPGATPLAHVAEEARAIRELVPGATVLPPAGTTTTRDMVTKALEQHQIAHFACHGIADLTNPPASRLLLHDHETSPLTLHTVTGLRLTDAYLAYLSACSTTDTLPAQADEATHLTAAFHLAGYRNVIGTLWSIDDLVAKTVAEDFHAQHVDPAEALHHALRRCRADHRERPHLWAAYVHTGT